MSKAAQFTYFTLLCITVSGAQSLLNAKPTHPKKVYSTPSIHEADEQDLKVLDHVAYLQREIASQINCCRSAAKAHELKQLFNELEVIAADYTQLAPGTAFLGPFSSVSLVLKQRELKARIKEIEKLIQ